MKYIQLILSLFITILSSKSFAQPNAEIEIKKPVKYENRKLASEKTGEKKFTVPKHIYQNTVTHYNYYFNANNRINEVITGAKGSFKENYSQLLPFYNYDLATTAQNKTELDSIIYKATAGILLHDLRNDWIDNMYLLLAKAYFLRNDLDSSLLTLQYLNFSFAPKEDGGYDKPIGSNSSNDEGEFSISTKEKNSIWTKLTSRPPSRNESFIWQIRSYIEKDELPEAAGLIEILRTDPNFPKRLNTDLEEMRAYWFYKQQIYDSAASHLTKALNEADNNQEKARWEYLIAQMYQLSNQYEKAVDFYEKSIQHTHDPVLDVYARLNAIRISKSDKKDYYQDNIDALVKMAKRDKYISYRDILYYAAATIELERKSPDAAQDFLLKSVASTENNPIQRSQSFLLLGDLNYDRKAYPPSYSFYDSVDANVLANPLDKERIALRKPPLNIIADNSIIIETEDSLQAIAKLPEEQRDALLKKISKQLRKAQGLKEEDVQSNNPAVMAQAGNLFADDAKSGDFYFYNASAKARGFSEFRSKWGERPNADNWRRSAVTARKAATPGNLTDIDTKKVVNATSATTVDALVDNLPLTEEKLNLSNNRVMEALFAMAQTFQSKLEDYPSAIAAYEELLRRFPNTSNKQEAMFNLVYAYQKTGDLAKSDFYKQQLLAGEANSKFAKLLKNPQAGKDTIQNSPATKKYEAIYNFFIEGQFERAKAEKKAADDMYGNSYWTPQLLFIESIYYVKQREDNTAIKILTDLTQLHAKSSMTPRAKTMIDVLKRRGEIEDYLTKLEVSANVDRPEVLPIPKVETLINPPVVKPAENKPVESKPIETKPVEAKPVETKPAEIKPVEKPKEEVKVAAPLITKTETPVIKKDTVAAKPAPTTKKDTVATKSAPATKKDTVPAKTTPITKTDTVVAKPAPAIKKDTVIAKPTPAKKDTVAAVKAAPVVKGFTFIASDPHYVVVLMDKVDEVYATEGRNAFNRYNRESFSTQRIDSKSLQLDPRFHLVLFGPFADANASVDYINKVSPVTKGRILPWLSADKYSFIVISETNLDLLKSNKDMSAYKELLQKAFPGKF